VGSSSRCAATEVWMRSNLTIRRLDPNLSNNGLAQPHGVEKTKSPALETCEKRTYPSSCGACTWSGLLFKVFPLSTETQGWSLSGWTFISYPSRSAVARISKRI
jgi:hypothetical protein